jgi:chromosome segregation ATPase
VFAEVLLWTLAITAFVFYVCFFAQVLALSRRRVAKRALEASQ